MNDPRVPEAEAGSRRIHALKALMAERIVVIDGAMGTMIQAHRLDEDGYRG
jgi:methionine synthase I (cobalamin-dependent)